MAESERMLV